jgi:flagellar basal-body rod protein FlgF
MSNGIYVAVSGSIANMDHLEVVSHGLAQANTTGFKRDMMSFEKVRLVGPGETAEIDDLQDKDFVRARQTHVNTQQGEMMRTGNVLDIALTGNGYLRIQTDQGERLTRDGRLMVNREGLLMTTSGNKLIGDGGQDIFLPPEQRPTFDSDGTVKAGTEIVGQLGLFGVADGAQLKKDSAGLIIPPDAAERTSLDTMFGVHQGHLESSNVKPVEMMVQLVNVQRNFEALHQVIQTYRRMDTAANRLVR